MNRSRLITVALLSLLLLSLGACSAGGPSLAPADPEGGMTPPTDPEGGVTPPLHLTREAVTSVQSAVDMPADHQSMTMEDHAAMEEQMPDEHATGAHAVPEEAAAVPNPVAATDASVAAGATIYAKNCAVCHGETGEGDGPGGVGLAVTPANLHADHVQVLTDGGLFYIVTHGRTETAMPAWEHVLSEEQRWQVVNFIRTWR